MSTIEKVCEKLPGKWRLPLAFLMVGAVTVIAYWRVLHNEFITFDDTDYVTVNMVVRQGLTFKGFLWSFTAFHAGNWHPLTWLSHMLDIELFDLNPMGHHATSLLLHVANSLLLCALLYRLTGYVGRSLVVALLFAIHPLHVESVAWVAERKDVLSTFFWFLTMAAYTGYARNRCLTRYLAVAALFALGLMAKQMLVTLPLIFLLMDYWPLDRPSPPLSRLLAEKVPFLLMSAMASIITLRAQDAAGALVHGTGHSILLSAGNALISYVKYIGKMLWPSDLALFYPFDPATLTPIRVAGAIVLLGVITGCVIALRGKRPYLVFGWFWYLITLLPVIGFIKVGSQAMADRYTYIPLTGLFFMIVWGGAEMAGKWRYGLRIGVCGAALVIVTLFVLTVEQIRYWHNSYDLYTHALTVISGNWLAHNNMGILLAQNYRNDEAIYQFQESVRLNPNGAEGFRNLGNVYQMVGRNVEAIGAFREAVRINPKDVESHFQLGYAYLLSGDISLAYQECQQLMQLDESRARPLLDSIKLRERP